MSSLLCWPYEELKVSKLEESPQAFLMETPWYSSVVKTTAEGALLFEKAFFQNVECAPEELLSLYSQILTLTLQDPFSYILAQNQAHSELGEETKSFLRQEHFQTPHGFAKALGLSQKYFPHEWTWDLEAVLSMAQIPGTEFYSPLALYSVFRRFFYMEALGKDKTQSLYGALPAVCKTKENTMAALAYVISQNLRVTQRCEAILTAALPNAGPNEERLSDFIAAEKGHDRIMSQALQAFPPEALPEWSLQFHEATDSMMDLFHRMAEHSFMSFAFAICLFERPQFEEKHPVTTLLEKMDLSEAARRYERHHTINEAGHHDDIGIDMMKEMPLLSQVEAVKALRFSEAFSFIMTSHSAALLEKIVNSSRN